MRCSSVIVARPCFRRAGTAQVAGAGCTRDPWRRASIASESAPRHVVTQDRMSPRSPEQGPECIPLSRPPSHAQSGALFICRRRVHVPSMTTRIETEPRQLGAAGPTVFPLALGCMAMSGTYGKSDEVESIATIHAALERGVTLLDTGDYYAAGHNEMLIGRALKDRRDKALLSVKFGALRAPDGAWIGLDMRPAAVKNFIGYTLNRLGVDHIDI